MTNLEKFKESPAWDSENNLPLCRIHANPHIYCAFADKICGGSISRDDVLRYQSICQTKIGLYHRYPDGGGGVTSFDELIGISHFNPDAASKILDYIWDHFGCYDNQSPYSWTFRYNLYRFPWFIAYLKIRAGRTLGPFLRLAFVMYLILQAIDWNPETKRDEGGKLTTWLMRDEMREVFGCRLAWKFWEYRTRNIGPKWCLTRYLVEYPVFFECAPEKFD